MKLRGDKTIPVAAIIFALCFAFMSPVSAEPTNLQNRLITCVHVPGKNDNCKDPAVATKTAPKDLKKEVERLADLIAISLPLAKAEAIKQSQVATAKFLKERNLLLLAQKQADDNHLTCLKVHRIKSGDRNPKNFCSMEFSKSLQATADLIDLSSVSNTDAGSGRYFEQWLSAWENLAILAKTFPQHIQPTQLPILLKAYENIKSCRANNSCNLR